MLAGPQSHGAHGLDGWVEAGLGKGPDATTFAPDRPEAPVMMRNESQPHQPFHNEDNGIGNSSISQDLDSPPHQPHTTGPGTQGQKDLGEETEQHKT